MEAENKQGLERNKEVKELFRKQRELAKKASRDLYKERLHHNAAITELEQFRMFYNSIREEIDTPEVLPLIINRMKIEKVPFIVEIPDDIEIDSP